ncbi:MAG: hypothetical protein OXC94_08705 [Chloroflexi bacterium]|nr:hypothetical protein [Chloroflexota bacterium]
MTSQSPSAPLTDGTGIPRGSFGLQTFIQLSSRQDYAIPAVSYQDFSSLVRRQANPAWNAPRRPQGVGRSA